MIAEIDIIIMKTIDSEDTLHGVKETRVEVMVIITKVFVDISLQTGMQEIIISMTVAMLLAIAMKIETLMIEIDLEVMKIGRIVLPADHSTLSFDCFFPIVSTPLSLLIGARVAQDFPQEERLVLYR